MARTQEEELATIESVLFNPDVVFLLAGLLDAQDLSHVSLTCKTLGGKQSNVLSLVEKAAKIQFEHTATDWERSCLRKYPDEGWVELYHHLLMLRSKLTFDQLVGVKIQCRENPSTIDFIPCQGCGSRCRTTSAALCSDHVMRSGKHMVSWGGDCSSEMEDWEGCRIGLIRPVQIDSAYFPLELGSLWNWHTRVGEFLRAQRTDRWSDSNIHCCTLSCEGRFNWYDWDPNTPNKCTVIEEFGTWPPVPTCLLLDLEEGSLTVYQDGKRLLSKVGLSGEYCWYTESTCACTVAIERGSVPESPGEWIGDWPEEDYVC